MLAKQVTFGSEELYIQRQISVFQRFQYVLTGTLNVIIKIYERPLYPGGYRELQKKHLWHFLKNYSHLVWFP